MASLILYICLCLIQLLTHTTSTTNHQCCAEPTHAFLIKQFHGPCACQTLHQKWLRYKDWIEKNNGFIHPFMDFRYITADNRGLFSTQKTIIESQDLLMQIPVKISFSQFIISKYFGNNRINIQHKAFNEIFDNSNINYFLPNSFPTHTEWIKIAKSKYLEFGALYHNKFHEKPFTLVSVGIRAWLALGFAFLKTFTTELLPWFELLPSPDYLPLLWPQNSDLQLLQNSETLKDVQALNHEFKMVYPYLDMLHLSETAVREAYALVASRLFHFDFTKVNGEHCVMIPAGFDFFNHDVERDSGIFYDSLFGAENKNNVEKYGNDKIMVGNIIKYNKNVETKESDFVSVYLWVNNDIHSGEEIFVSYGDRMKSSSRVAKFGFMDEAEYMRDFVVIRCIPFLSDANLYHKYDILAKVNVVYPIDLLWYHHRYKKQSFFVRFTEQFLMYLRFIFLSEKHFDSFTISSILNQFETRYLEKYIDPNVESSIHSICEQRLRLYPTTITKDKDELRKLKADTSTPKHMHTLARHILIRKILIREKTFFHSCQNMRILHN